MASGPKASIVIATYNGRHYLANCLASVLSQAGAENEVVVVDNRSTDGSVQFIGEHFPSVRLIENQENHGFAAACNQGARAAIGQILVFLNQDTIVLPGWLSGLTRELETGAGVGLTTSQLRLMRRPDSIHLCGQDVHYSGLVFGRDYARPAAGQAQPCDVNAVSGASFAIRRELWEELGGFDETLYMYYEETDLSWRALLAGYRCRYVPASQALHDYQPGSPSDTRLYYSFRNRGLVALKNWHPTTLLLLGPALFMAEVLELGLAFAQGGRGIRAKGKSYGWIATHLSQVRRMRAAAQVHRRVPDAAILNTLAGDIRPTQAYTDVGPSWIVTIANLIFQLNRRIALWALRSLSLDAPDSGHRARS